MKVRIHAWLEEREIPGLDPAFRGIVEVYRDTAYVPLGGGGSPVEVVDLVDRILAELLDENDEAGC